MDVKLKKTLRYVVFSFLILLCLLVALVFWATGMFFPKAIQTESFTNSKDALKLKFGQSLKVLSWNVQYMAGNKNNNFFYESGNDPFPESEVYRRTIAEVAKVIRQVNPDLILLQELDLDSQRSHNINEFKELMLRLPKDYGSYSCTHYHQVNFVPLRAMPGKVTFALCTISKYRISKAIRYALPSKLDVNFLEQQFQLKRGILRTDLEIDGGGVLQVFHTHFSAFAANTDTPLKQAKLANQLLLQAEQVGPALLAGDFNALASAIFYKDVFPTERHLYFKDYSPIADLIKNFRMFPTIAELSGPQHDKWLTYMPGRDPEHKPRVTIDFMFITRQLQFTNYYVLQQNTKHISDHFPLVAEIRLPGVDRTKY